MLLVAQSGNQRRPPAVGEVLRLVDDEGVKAFRVHQVRRHLTHLQREPNLPIVAVVVEPSWCAPGHAEVVEGADVRRSLVGRQQLDAALEIGGETARIAQQADPLALLREPARLLDREPGLARSPRRPAPRRGSSA